MKNIQGYLRTIGIQTRREVTGKSAADDAVKASTGQRFK